MSQDMPIFVRTFDLLTCLAAATTTSRAPIGT
jgi:hypothetical protein